MQPVESDVQAMHRKRLEELSSRKNTTVLDVTHDTVRDPWPVSRLRAVMESITSSTVGAKEEEETDFARRQRLMTDDEEVLSFQRLHPKMYWMLTDRSMMRSKQHRDAITGMLYVQQQVENGSVSAGQEADAMATRTVLAALGTKESRP